MATGTIVVDARNPAQRRYIYQPYWISSLPLKALEIGSDETKIGIMASFPLASYGGTTKIKRVYCPSHTDHLRRCQRCNLRRGHRPQVNRLHRCQSAGTQGLHLCGAQR